MTAYAALLRAVNVGGIKVLMKDLRAVFADLGYPEATTYLQSGNVVFTSSARAQAKLGSQIRQRIVGQLGVDTPIMLRTHADLLAVLAGNPYLDRTEDHTKLGVAFLADESPNPEQLTVPAGDPAECTVLGREVYLHCPDGFGQTKLTTAYLERKLGVAATARNWRTVKALRDMTAG
jgi:uncharacterized protein (DUF1697 family)